MTYFCLRSSAESAFWKDLSANQSFSVSVVLVSMFVLMWQMEGERLSNGRLTGQLVG